MKRINLHIGKRDNPQKVRRLRRIIKRLTPVFLVLLSLVALAVFITSLSSTTSVINYIFSGTYLKSSEGRVNVLLLGMAGSTHAGATLTDTILVASYNLRTNKVHLISIPRDLWLPSLRSKANAVYEIGLAGSNGLGFAKTVVGNIVGLPLHYGLRIDFSGFVKAIDILGGIDVLVEKSFDDYKYPIEGREDDLCGWEEKEMDIGQDQAIKLNIQPGKRKVLVDQSGKIATDSAEPERGFEYFPCRHEAISFKRGKTFMDGTTALKFVRSRMGTEGEGSDFARSKRQQKVLEAARGKTLSLETLANPQKISELIKIFGKSIDSDISVREAVEFYSLIKKLEKVSSFVLDDSLKMGLPEGRRSLLYHPAASDYGGAYVLVSEDDDFFIIHNYIRKVISGEVEQDEATSSARVR